MYLDLHLTYLFFQWYFIVWSDSLAWEVNKNEDIYQETHSVASKNIRDDDEEAKSSKNVTLG